MSLLPAPSESLQYRQFDAGDEAFVIKLLNEPGFLRYIGDKGVRDDDSARRYLAEGPQASYAAHGFGLLRVSTKTTDEPVGMCGFLKRDGLECPDLGYAMLQAYSGQGLATEAASNLLAFGFASLGFARVLAVVMPGNDRSIRLLERIGMRREGLQAVPGIDGEQELFSIERDNSA